MSGKQRAEKHKGSIFVGTACGVLNSLSDFACVQQVVSLFALDSYSLSIFGGSYKCRCCSLSEDYVLEPTESVASLRLEPEPPDPEH